MSATTAMCMPKQKTRRNVLNNAFYILSNEQTFKSAAGQPLKANQKNLFGSLTK